ncbi:hypothetical protein SLE2022_162070 [Rubroshorea leprosula]
MKYSIQISASMTLTQHQIQSSMELELKEKRGWQAMRTRNCHKRRHFIWFANLGSGSLNTNWKRLDGYKKLSGLQLLLPTSPPQGAHLIMLGDITVHLVVQVLQIHNGEVKGRTWQK